MSERNSAEILKFEYQQSNYPEWLQQFATAMGRKVDIHASGLSMPVGDGFSKAYSFEDGLSCAVHNYRLSKDKAFIRLPADEFGVIIHFCHIDTATPIQYFLNDLSYTLEPGVYNSLTILNAQTRQEFVLAGSTKYKGISIYLENKWIEENISATASEALAYLRSVLHFKGFVQAKQQKLVDEITSMAEFHPYPNIHTKSRIYRLLDKIFEDFSNGVYKELHEKLSTQDFTLLQKVENILSNNFPDPFPSIEKLSKVALMSESKLKRLFKQAYGMGLYEYFQKNRLHKAKELLLSEQNTITEVGVILGYQNLSNFSAAFRKEFNCLPSEMGRQN